MMIVIFVSRGVCSVILSLVYPLMEAMDTTASYAIQSLMSLVFLYLIPMGFAVFIMKEPKKETRRRIYSKPVYFGNALGMFPAFYGVGIFVNVVTLVVSFLLSKADLNKSFNTVNELRADNIYCALILLFQLVVIAPLFEEFWFRGIVMESLRPYGNGFAIFVSALLFGMTHANFQQFFYATALGICFGYVAISTKSIITSTVMHAMLNSVGGLLLFFMSIDSVGDYLLAAQNGGEAVMTPAVVVYLVFMFLVIMLLLVGLVMAVFKLRKIKRYKVPKIWTEVSTGKRWGIFFSRVTVIIMLVLAADTFTRRLLPELAYKAINGLFGG